MSNANLAARMQEMLLRYEKGILSPHSLEVDFETCMQSMERIDSEKIHASRQLIARLMHAHFWLGETEFGDTERAVVVLAELRQFIEGLPGTGSPH